MAKCSECTKSTPRKRNLPRGAKTRQTVQSSPVAFSPFEHNAFKTDLTDNG